ncbi:MAG: nicotinate-nucleotide adenylyltransferase [Planctomycetales bacterium]
MRLGIFGGTFDPVHQGHLLLAERCREQAALDTVWFVPAAVSPHKQEHPPASAEARADMLELAVAGNDAFAVYRDEIERGGVSYTVDTLRRMQETHPDAELFFLMGADSLESLPTWREPEEICRLATVVAINRGGAPEPDFDVLRPVCDADRIESFRRVQVTMGAMEISSTDVRRRVAEGKSIRYQTPRAVEQYIRTHRLYQPPAE